MTAWLVDTQALLWFLTDDRRLSETAKATMESGESVLLVSSASLWEMAIKHGLGQATLEDLPLISNDPQLDQYGIERLW